MNFMDSLNPIAIFIQRSKSLSLSRLSSPKSSTLLFLLLIYGSVAILSKSRQKGPGFSTLRAHHHPLSLVTENDMDMPSRGLRLISLYQALTLTV